MMWAEMSHGEVAIRIGQSTFCVVGGMASDRRGQANSFQEQTKLTTGPGCVVSPAVINTLAFGAIIPLARSSQPRRSSWKIRTKAW
jgi:hypothetical protein